MHAYFAISNPFDLIFGLPVHPLAVHLPVVLVPLGAITLLLMLVVPRWRAALAWPTIVMLGIGALGAVAAKFSGEALARRIGVSPQHADLGQWLMILALALFAASLAWWLWQRSLKRRRRPNGAVGLIAGSLVGALAIGALVVSALTGHSGAEAAWEDRIAPAAETSETTGDAAEATPAATEAAATAEADAAAGITLADVAQNNTQASCWTTIEGTVYDLTDWIDRHPGGPEQILGVCGTDATAAFGGQHGADAGIAELLTQFEIGTLAEG